MLVRRQVIDLCLHLCTLPPPPRTTSQHANTHTLSPNVTAIATITIAVLVKMERRPFAAGAMRECFALKKLSTFSSSVYRCVKHEALLQMICVRVGVGQAGGHCVCSSMRRLSVRRCYTELVV